MYQLYLVHIKAEHRWEIIRNVLHVERSLIQQANKDLLSEGGQEAAFIVSHGPVTASKMFTLNSTGRLADLL